MRILVAADLTSRSDRALLRAFQIARDTNGALSVLHVVDADLPDELRRHTEAWAHKTLSAEISRLSAETGVHAAIEVFVGRPRVDIPAKAAESMTDLIVLGVHDTREKTSFAETTAGKILKSTLTATLIVRSDAAPYREVVVGVDFSMFSRAAIRQALGLAPHARINLVHAYHVPFEGFLGSRGFKKDYAAAQRLEFDTFLKTEMAVLKESLPTGRLPSGGVVQVIEDGEPASVLRRACQRLGADLIAIGTHSRAGVSRAVWGSVAVDILDNPPCDVLVIKPY